MTIRRKPSQVDDFIYHGGQEKSALADRKSNSHAALPSQAKSPHSAQTKSKIKNQTQTKAAPQKNSTENVQTTQAQQKIQQKAKPPKKRSTTKIVTGLVAFGAAAAILARVLILRH